MTPQETARAILALYDGKPERWTKRAFARDDEGEPPLDDEGEGERYEAEDNSCATAPTAVCWCLEGAALRVGCYEYGALRDVADKLGLLGEHNGLYDFNDAPERTFADVVALLERIAAEPTP